MKLPAIAGATAAAAVLTLTLAAAPAIAGSPGGHDKMNPCAMKTNPCAMKMNPCAMKERMAKHHAMKKEHMGMMREVMVILRDLKHKPTAEQKKRLDYYIDRLDEGLAKCKVWDKESKEGGAHHAK